MSLATSNYAGTAAVTAQQLRPGVLTTGKVIKLCHLAARVRGAKNGMPKSRDGGILAHYTFLGENAAGSPLPGLPFRLSSQVP
jgi:hypothetical protein